MSNNLDIKSLSEQQLQSLKNQIEEEVAYRDDLKNKIDSTILVRLYKLNEEVGYEDDCLTVSVKKEVNVYIHTDENNVHVYVSDDYGNTISDDDIIEQVNKNKKVKTRTAQLKQVINEYNTIIKKIAEENNITITDVKKRLDLFYQ